MASFSSFRMRRKRMDDPGGGPAPSWHEVVSVEGERIFLLAGDAPLPEGVREGDEGVFVIRLVAPTPADVEAANAAY
jgi:hypothetical protein